MSFDDNVIGYEEDIIGQDIIKPSGLDVGKLGLEKQA